VNAWSASSIKYLYLSRRQSAPLAGGTARRPQSSAHSYLASEARRENARPPSLTDGALTRLARRLHWYGAGRHGSWGSWSVLRYRVGEACASSDSVAAKAEELLWCGGGVRGSLALGEGVKTTTADEEVAWWHARYQTEAALLSISHSDRNPKRRALSDS